MFWEQLLTQKDSCRNECPTRRQDIDSRSGWFESNCTKQQPVEMDIWEPCNYISNLAYDRLAVEMCLQQGWALSPHTVSKIAQAFAINTFASAFMHGSDTHLGASQDVRSNDLFPFIIYQARQFLLLIQICTSILLSGWCLQYPLQPCYPRLVDRTKKCDW